MKKIIDFFFADILPKYEPEKTMLKMFLIILGIGIILGFFIAWLLSFY